MVIIRFVKFFVIFALYCYVLFNPLMGKLKLQSNGSLYSIAVIGTLTVDGLAFTFGTARRGLGGLLLAVL